ncbi:MAG: hypothetical protein Q9M91_04960 [Candidatus Dojkabacteria bacterium]|nr:hypothetical protein [Candidatus Dojkabacteria bacterium]MDQ7021158.1 hypothetical protein [Candidatus Dojkabacteria bacterium]
MNINRPLMNPTAKDINREEKSIEVGGEKKIRLDKEQLSFNTESKAVKLKQIINTLRGRINKRFELLELSAFWKSFANPLLIVTFLANEFILLFLILFRFDNLPDRIRFFYNSVDNSWEQIDKKFLYALPIILFVVFQIQIRLITVTFKINVRTSRLISWIMAFIYTFLFIAIMAITKTYSIIN